MNFLINDDIEGMWVFLVFSVKDVVCIDPFISDFWEMRIGLMNDGIHMADDEGIGPLDGLVIDVSPSDDPYTLVSTIVCPLFGVLEGSDGDHIGIWGRVLSGED